MPKKIVVSISDVARMGAQAQLKKYGKRQLRKWGKLGGRPKSFASKSLTEGGHRNS